jgi:hypothetical protein
MSACHWQVVRFFGNKFVVLIQKNHEIENAHSPYLFIGSLCHQREAGQQSTKGLGRDLTK